MTRAPLRTLALVGALALTAACGSGGGDDTAAQASPSDAPSASASASAECPITAVQVPPPAGVSADLTVKPDVPGSSAPAPTELQYADLVVGTGAEAVTGSRVEVKYVGAFYETGDEFDASWAESPDKTIPFSICRSGVVPGFAVGPSGMKVGGRRYITIPSKLAYGAAGRPPVIGKNATLVFVVDLVKVG